MHKIFVPLILVFLIMFIPSVLADWDDYFTDNDYTNYKEWSDPAGVYQVFDQHLEKYGQVGAGDALIVTRSIVPDMSNIDFLNATMDIKFKDLSSNAPGYVRMEIMNNESAGIGYGYGYGASLVADGPSSHSIYIYKSTNDGSIDVLNTTSWAPTTDWKTMNMIKYKNGSMYLYLNGTLKIEAHDDDYNVSEYFTIRCGFGTGWANHNISIDNITVDNAFSDDLVIHQPESITYYNNFTLPLIVENVSFEYEECNYSLNGGINISFDMETTVSVESGSNTIEIWCNDNIYDSVNFDVVLVCNSTTENDTICGGPNYQSVIICKKFGKNAYQWDQFNMTYCKYGCFDGRCLDVNATTKCSHECVENETLCLNDYVITCNQSLEGCWRWNDSEKTYCENGCYKGGCVSGINYCELGESRCFDDIVRFCHDDNGDGYREWSKYNVTNCEYRCDNDYNTVTGRYNASCHYHSYTVPSLISSTFDFIGTTVQAPAVNTQMKSMSILIVAMLLAGILGFIINWRLGGVSFFIVMVLGSVIGWLPWYVMFVIIILGGAVIFIGGRE